MTIFAGPSYLTPTWRYAGDDWAGSNALTYEVYSVPPVYASDGVTITTPGTPMDLTGNWSVSGTITYRPRPVVTSGRYGEAPAGPPLSGVVGSIITPAAGLISLSVPQANTAIAPQDIAAWYGDGGTLTIPASGACALLLAQPMITDPSGNLITVGLQPLYVFGK